MTEATFTSVDFDPFAGGELLLTAPATEAQKEIWLSVQMGDEANCAFNESGSLRLRGPLDVEALTMAVQQLVERHEALHTTFSPDGNTLCVLPAQVLNIPFIDLSGLNEAEQASQLAEILRQDVEQPFHLEHGPLVRAQIVRLRPDQHQFIITAHHIVCDGWSWGVLMPELGKLYSALRQGLTAKLPEPDQFSRYAVLQDQQPVGNDEQYWLDQFSEQVPLVDLATDFPRPSLRTFNANRVDLEVNPELMTHLKKMGVKAGVSFFNVLLAGFEVFLHRLTGQDDLVVGLSAAGQSITGHYNLVGHCVNLLPLRTRVDGHQPFTTYLKMCRSALLDAYDHQQFTFGSLVNQLNIPRDPSRIPLAPITFNLDQALESESLSFDGLEADFFSNPRHFENFEIFINAVEYDNRLVLECQYNTDLFRADTILRRLAEFETLLAGIAADPDQPISKLPILPESEQQLLAKWNATQMPYLHRLGVHQLIEQQTVKTPTDVAVIFEDQQLTYQEINQQANQLAHRLQQLGVGPQTLVGICVNRSAMMVVGVLGILKAGGAYVPMDPAYPTERLAYMLQDAQAKILLTEINLLSQLPEHSVQVVYLDKDWPAIAAHSSENLASQTHPEHLAYVIYTSGSTGKPKGVQVPHQTVVNFLSSMAREPGLTDQDILLAVTTLSFDIAVLELFLPLIVGAKVIVASREVASDGLQLLKQLTQSEATMLQATPATWQMLLEAGWPGDNRLKVLCGGEAFPPDLARELVNRASQVWNMYGPTETTVWSTCYHLTDPQGPISIGQPIANTQIYLLDRYQQPTLIGVPGELYIGGHGVVRGYMNRPQLTAERFVPDPFSPAPNARMYRTGDLARYWPDGNIEYYRRLDTQVKVRGFRIELGEIEMMLTEHPAVEQAVALAREDMPGDKALVAYIVADKHHPAEETSVANNLTSQLRTYLREKLPAYMVPSYYVMLNSFPLTPNGKVDRKALPTPDQTRIAQQEQFVDPRTLIETQIAAIWAEILHLDKVGVYDNFFELGGHSLLAIQIIIRLRDIFDIELSLASLFETPTVETLAERVEALCYVQEAAAIESGDEEYERFEI